MRRPEPFHRLVELAQLAVNGVIVVSLIKSDIPRHVMFHMPERGGMIDPRCRWCRWAVEQYAISDEMVIDLPVVDGSHLAYLRPWCESCRSIALWHAWYGVLPPPDSYCCPGVLKAISAMVVQVVSAADLVPSDDDA